ncbi:MAG TPA: phosphate signaling complex protein PhoU [Alphaproteobacteria bacterium]|jgi:phosphate transport system protein
MADHTVKSYDDELKNLHEDILRMGGIAEAQFASAIQAVTKRDADVAALTVKGDVKLDELNAAIDQRVVRMLALRQPMASDLREIISSLKIAADVERIGDYAANIAKRSIAIAEMRPVKPLNSIPRMGRLVQHLIKDVLDAYNERNADKAKQVWLRDEEVDDAYNSLFRETLTYMMEDPRNITPCTHLLFVAKNIERIGDHATNVAETIYFIVHGTTLGAMRPKGDSSSFLVVSPDDEAPRA